MTEHDQSGPASTPPEDGEEDAVPEHERVAIRLNGEERRIPRGWTAARLLDELALEPGEVVVEVNRDIVRREGLEEAVLEAGDRVELVRFVGGG